ncbi:CPBP family intramembrane glutamic endopeptidase [Kribbella flavida]|uniref:CPBP family intramembrane glutamic endopeptidase n=1 Tax=Kribbella flavida TaxID=182640 RepID=UPI00019BE351|nr:type II CAAX endopeptidase family protein [Kribbella flavida]
MPDGRQLPGEPGFWSPEQPPPWPGYQPAGHQLPAANHPPAGQQGWAGQQPPYGQPPNAPAPYGQQYGQPPQGPPYGPGPYGPPPGQPPYGPGQYGPAPYGPMPYGMRPPEPRHLPAPPGTPFHQLARNPKHTWWRPLVGTGVLVAIAFFLTAAVLVIWSVVHGVISGDVPDPQGDQIFPNDTENLALTLVMLAVLTPAVAFTAWVIQRRPPWSIASVLNRVRWKWLLLCCLPALGYLALSYVLGLLVEQIFPTADPIPADEGSWVGFAAFVGPAVLILLLVPFQASAEEFVFRGWLIQTVGAYAPQGEGRNGFTRIAGRVLRTPWPALVVTSVLFVSAHGYTGWAMADIFLFAMTVGWLTVRTGGLEAAIAIHTLNNLLAFLLPAATGQLDGWADQGGAPWTVLAVDIPCLAFFAVSVVWLAKRRRVAQLSA